MTMEKEVLLSFCIPTYNQGELAKGCVEKILEYRGNDIEVIVSDNASTDNTEELIKSIDDNRLYYFKNELNLGHDLNIIQSFRHANADFVFLLITRDSVIPESIPLILSELHNHNDVVYLTGSALREGKKFLSYERKWYKKGREALDAVANIVYVHPSGSVYKITEMDLDLLENFIKVSSEPSLSMAHILIGITLATKGNFLIISETIWNLEKYTPHSISKYALTQSRIPVYSPVYIKKSFFCICKWLIEQIEDDTLKKEVIENYFARYLYDITWGFRRNNKNPKMWEHYACEKIDCKIAEERHKFLGEIEANENVRPILIKGNAVFIMRAKLRNILIDPVVDLLLKWGANSRIHFFYRKYIRKHK